MIPLNEFKQGFKTKNFKSFYVFTGPEIAIMDTYIKKLAEVKEANVVYADSITEIVNRQRSQRMLGSTNKCYIVHGDSGYQKDEKMWNLSQQSLNYVIILVTHNLDKRTKFYKQHDHCMVEFEKLSEDILVKYVTGMTYLHAETAIELVNLCEKDYNKILLEIDKIIDYANAKGIEDEESFHILYEAGAIYTPPQDAIFSLTDAICNNLPQSAFDYWQDCKGVGENPLAIISVLYKNIRSMYAVAIDGGGQGVIERTGLTPFQVKLAKEKMNAYMIHELYENMKLIQKTEQGIKTGDIDSAIAIDYIMIKMFTAEGLQF